MKSVVERLAEAVNKIMLRAVEECDKCPVCGKGFMKLVPNGICSCHGSVPCIACMTSYLECDSCKWEKRFGGFKKDEIVMFLGDDKKTISMVDQIKKEKL